jgi:hypothetical protein
MDEASAILILRLLHKIISMKKISTEQFVVWMVSLCFAFAVGNYWAIVS